MIATSCAQNLLLQLLCRCSLSAFSGAQCVKIFAYWNLLLEQIIFMNTWKINNIFLLHSKENKYGIISKLFVLLIPPETKGTNIMLYSVKNDVKVGILPQERCLQDYSEKAWCITVLQPVQHTCMWKKILIVGRGKFFNSRYMCLVQNAVLCLLIWHFLGLWICHVHLYFAIEGPYCEKSLILSNFPETTEILACLYITKKRQKY